MTHIHNMPFIGLEVHDASLWDVTRMLNAVARMRDYGYNALVLHENDLLDSCSQIGDHANFGLFDLRFKKVSNKLAWLNRLVRELDSFGAKLFLEVKEPSYHDYILHSFKGLIDADGRIDPTSPAWTDLCATKVRYVLDNVPGLGGMIVNLSSPESRVSLQDYLADKNKVIDIDNWLDRMINAFRVPLIGAGKRLFVRDFAYTKELQKKTLDAIDRCGGEVGASIKITAHDYFPKVENNTVAQDVTAPKIIELESFGEHMGWGLVPNIRVDEWVRRFGFMRAVNAQGFINRISWEAMTGPHAIECLSDVNVYTAAELAKRPDADAPTLITEWLGKRYGVSGAMAHTLVPLLRDSWHVVAAAYWHEKVFPRHSRLPATWQEGWHSMLTSGMGNRLLDDKDLKISPDDQATLFAEKDEAVQTADRLWTAIQALKPTINNDTLWAHLCDPFALLPLYARMFAYATKGTVLAANGYAADREALTDYKEKLMSLADEAETFITTRPHAPHTLSILINPSHIRGFAESLG